MSAATRLLSRVTAAGAERARAEAAMAQRFAPGFNPVALLSPGENDLSKVFGWLLDEAGTHGQGPAFRDSFVSDLLNDDPGLWARARLAAEVSTNDGLGRIDLLMESGDASRCVVIENKPWAGWQTNQLRRYLEDQRGCRAEVRVHALIGHADVAGSLKRHWRESSDEPLPAAVTASGFDDVVAWLDRCGAICRAERVRGFLNDLADHCRKAILSEGSMEETTATADLILAGGEEAVSAAQSIAAALPLALTTAAATRVAGIVQIVANQPTVRITINGVPVNFVLFGDVTPCAGVTEKACVPLLTGYRDWGKPERLWPRWQWLKRLGAEGEALTVAANAGDLAAVERLLPIVARAMIGPVEATSR